MNDDLLVAYLLGELPAEERSRVEAWIVSDPANRIYFEQFKMVWEQSRRLAAATTTPNEEAAWMRFRERIRESGNGSATIRRIPWLRIAAIFLLVAAGSIVLYLSQQNQEIRLITARTASTVLKDTLPDGSVITLNKNTALSYPEKFTKESRKVQLKGEAFFEVKPDKKKPFIIEVNDVTVKVVGTSFNIRNHNGETEVIVETGVVQVTRNGKTVELRPKEKVHIEKGDTVLQKAKETEKLYNYYRSHEFVCDGTPLWKLVEILNEAYGQNIVIKGKELRSMRITTTFSNESLDHILEIIRITFNIHYTKSDDRILLY